MNRILLQIKVKYEEMGNAEKKIADWLLLNHEAILPLSIIELADRCKCSEATIVRFARRLGLSGYQELKISIARESGKKNISSSISPSDSCFTVYEKVVNDIYYSLEMTKKALDANALDAAVNAVTQADGVYIFGLGNSSAVAADAAHKLTRAGIRAFACSDNHMQAILASHLTRHDLAVGISHSGSSKDIVDAMRIAKLSGAKTMCITNKGKSPIQKHSDIILYTASSETEYTILGLNSRIAALSIIDSIYSYIVCHGDNRVKTAIEKTESALKDKKF